MADPFRGQKIQNWAAEFSDRDAVRSYPHEVRDCMRELVAVFLETACAKSDSEPDALTESDLKAGLLEGVARLCLSASAHENAPALCAEFVEELQRQGRMASGRTLAPFVRALRGSYRERLSGSASAAAGQPGKGKPFVHPGSKLGLNDPCPCGSGMKYKKCCKRLLG